MKLYDVLIFLNYGKSKKNFYFNCLIPLIPYAIILLYLSSDFSKLNILSVTLSVIFCYFSTQLFLKTIKDQKNILNALFEIRSIYISSDKSNLVINRVDGYDQKIYTFNEIERVIFNRKRFVFVLRENNKIYLIDSKLFSLNPCVKQNPTIQS
jgi:uncharacterized membrane protein (GlpM family)